MARFARVGSFLFWLCLLWRNATRVVGGDGLSDNDVWRLRNDLLGKGYDPGTRPASHANDTTQIMVHMDLIDGPYLHPDEELFDADIGLCMGWKDLRLRWNETDYGGQKYLRVKTEDIWTPALYMISAWSDVRSSIFSNSMVDVSAIGIVLMCSVASVQSFCNADMTHFPMDRHECLVEYSPILDVEKDVNLTVERVGTKMAGDFEFELVSLDGESTITDYGEYGRYSSVKYRFILQRRNLFQHFTLLLPAVAVVSLSLLALWLPPTSDRRFVVAGVTYLTSLLLLYRADAAAAGSTAVPKISIVLSTSVLVNALTIVLTIVNMNLVRCLPKWKMPALVAKVAGLIATGVPLVCPGPSASSETSTAGSADQSARVVTRALDRLFFVACVLTFIAIIM
ncbi:hypothetical protein V5799_029619 [Amblyomma americanum]|uniref:Neurotransmitter-gated ion-channel ligand-binding domain-containing protein n=1 Tax=Amblyomma americanum TaxID=6943 RepID=A0AAQ4EQT9_AMBAM